MDKKTTSTELTLFKDVNNPVQNLQTFKSIDEFRLACQNFTNRLQTLPGDGAVGETPDGNAKTVFISHIEMTLDEFFFGLWETENFKWTVISNEVVGSIELVLTHPVTGQRYRRTGAASIQIMVDRVPEAIKNDKSEAGRIARNQWALDVANKKSGALDMGFPKLKAECVKNAAQSLGKLFGRDLNRKVTDEFQPLVKKVVEIPEELKAVVEETWDLEAIQMLWLSNKDLHNNAKFLPLLNTQKEKIKERDNQGGDKK